MSYSDQTRGENLSRGHYQTIPRDFKSLDLPAPRAKRKERTLRGVVVLILVMGPWVLVANGHNLS